MPIISRVKMFVLGAEFTRVIRVLKDGRFHIDLPDSVATGVGYKTVDADTQSKAEQLFNQAVAAAATARTTLRKVIICDYQAACYIWDGDEVILCDNLIDHSHHLAFHDGGGLTVFAQVYMEQRLELVENKRAKFRYKYVHMDSSIPTTLSMAHAGHRRHDFNADSPPAHVLEWTQEREDFFANLGRGLDAIIMAVHKLLSSADVGKLIDCSGGKLQLGYTPQPRTLEHNAETVAKARGRQRK